MSCQDWHRLGAGCGKVTRLRQNLQKQFKLLLRTRCLGEKKSQEGAACSEAPGPWCTKEPQAGQRIVYRSSAPASEQLVASKAHTTVQLNIRPNGVGPAGQEFCLKDSQSQGLGCEGMSHLTLLSVLTHVFESCFSVVLGRPSRFATGCPKRYEMLPCETACAPTVKTDGRPEPDV